MPQTAPMMSLPISMFVLQLITLTASLIYFSNHAAMPHESTTKMTPNNTYWLW